MAAGWVGLATAGVAVGPAVEVPVSPSSCPPQAIAKKAKLHALTAKFLGVLVENRRLANLEKVATTFARLLSDFKGEVAAEVKVAEKMTKAQQDALKKQLKKNLGQDIAFEVEVDPELLGGLVVKVGSKVIDSSIKTKLENLTLAMKGV